MEGMVLWEDAFIEVYILQEIGPRAHYLVTLN